ncbi:MAG: thiamine diphosphokinase [Acidimicrobiales bacterium]
MAAPGASNTVVVVTGGDPVDPTHLRDLPPGARVVAADSGIDHAHALGLVVDLAIGDFDSVSAEGLLRAHDDGATMERHPTAKDATDLELALDAALSFGPSHIHVLGGHGGRLDHLLANALLLGSPTYAAALITAQMGAARVTIVWERAELHGPLGDTVSLLPLHGRATGVRTTGLLYPLVDEDLLPGSSRGISNELVDEHARVTVTAGVLAAIQPGRLDPNHQEIPR